MPIKFRCQECRQFLGISREKAGSLVDCPTCGRTIRVPELDGRIKPIPKPGLNLEDSRLASALDELASIEKPPAGDADEKDAADGDSPDVVITADEPEPIELAPLPAPEPIEPGPISDGESSSGTDRGRPWASTAQGGDSWKRLIASGALHPDESDSSAGPVKATEPRSNKHRATDLPQSRTDSRRATVFGRLSGSAWFALAGLTAALFATGFWVGRITTTASNDATPDSTVSIDGATDVPVDDSNGDGSFSGRVSWQNEELQWKADRGARVIVLPMERKGSTRISVNGLRNGDSDEDRKVATSFIQEMGGQVAITNDAGRFVIDLENAGQYHVLILSASLERDTDSNDETTKSILDAFFERPAQLLGSFSYRLHKVRYTATESAPLDCAFGR